jgi:hypothetical protein
VDSAAGLKRQRVQEVMELLVERHWGGNIFVKRKGRWPPQRTGAHPEEDHALRLRPTLHHYGVEVTQVAD